MQDTRHTANAGPDGAAESQPIANQDVTRSAIVRMRKKTESRIGHTAVSDVGEPGSGLDVTHITSSSEKAYDSRIKT